MSKKKRFLSVFAIIFSLVFALALVFGAACGKNNEDDDTKDNEPEITEPEDDGSGEGSGSGSGDGSGSGSGNTDTEGDGSGSGSGSGDGSGSGSGDGSGSGSGSGTVTIPDDAENVYPLKVDFSDSNTYTWIDNVESTDGTMTDTGEAYQYLSVEAGSYTTGLVTYVAIGNSTIGKDKAGALYTSSDKNSYFAIDLSGLDGDYIEIEASMCGNSDNGTADRILAVATSNEAPTAGASTVLDYVASKTKSEVEDLDYVGIVADNTLYITWDNNIQIFSIEINIYGDKKPDFSGSNKPATVTGVSLSTDKITRVVGGTYGITATVSTDTGSAYAWTGDEEWKSEEESIATVTPSANGSATIMAVGAGTTTVTLTIDENNFAECTVVVSAATEANPTAEGGYTVNFSDSETYKWIETVQVYDDSNEAYEELESGKTFTDGLLTLVTGSSMKIQSNALSTGGTSSASQRYIKIDLSQYVGKTVSISAEMLSGSSGKNRSLILGTAVATEIDTTAETYLTSASSSSNSSSDTKSVLSYEGAISEGEVLYLSWVGDPTVTGSSADSGNIKIYNLNITVSEEATVEHQHEATVTWNWADDYSSATATFTCTAEGCDWEENEYTVSEEYITVEVTQYIQQPTCGKEGKGNVKATITGTSYSETKNTVTLPATGNHTYEAAGYLYDEDGEVSSDGWYVVCSVCGATEGTAITSAGGYTFTVETLEELTSAMAFDGASIVLGADITGTFTVSGAVTLDLNGHTVQNVEENATDYGSEKNTITVTENGSLTILDSSCAAGSTVGTGSVKNYYSTTLNGSETSGYSSDSAAVIFTTGTVVINSGLIDGASVGIRAQAGSVTINGGKITSDFYVIWEDVGTVTVTVNDGEIYGVRKGIYVGGDADFGLSGYQTGAKTTLIINGGSVTCRDDSAICTYGYTSIESAYIEINGGTIASEYKDDTTAGSGDSSSRIPAIFLPGGTLKVTGGTISGATALEVRGGSVTITGGTFETTATAANTPEFQQSGATSYGYAVAVYPFGESNARYISDSTYDISTTVTISGGTFNGGVYGTGETTCTIGSNTYNIPYTMTISGGYFLTVEGLDGFVEDGKKFEICIDEGLFGWYEVVDESLTRYVYDFTDTDWTSSLTRDTESGVMSFDDGGILKSTESSSSSASFTESGFKTGATTGGTSSATNYMAIDLSQFASAESVSVTITFASIDGNDVKTAFSSLAIPFTQYSSRASADPNLKVKDTMTWDGDDLNVGDTFTATYEINLSDLTENMLYVLWNADLYICNIVITVVEESV